VADSDRLLPGFSVVEYHDQTIDELRPIFWVLSTTAVGFAVLA